MIITPTLTFVGGFGKQRDVNFAIDAKFREVIGRNYFQLDLHLNDNTTIYQQVADIDYGQRIQVFMMDNLYEFAAISPSDLLEKLDNWDIGFWFTETGIDLEVISFHGMGDIFQGSTKIFEVLSITEGTYVPTVADVVRELAFKSNPFNLAGYDATKDQWVGHLSNQRAADGSPVGGPGADPTKLRWINGVSSD